MDPDRRAADPSGRRALWKYAVADRGRQKAFVRWGRRCDDNPQAPPDHVIVLPARAAGEHSVPSSEHGGVSATGPSRQWLDPARARQVSPATLPRLAHRVPELGTILLRRQQARQPRVTMKSSLRL